MYQGDITALCHLWVGVHIVGFAVRGPTGMGNTEVSLQIAVCDLFASKSATLPFDLYTSSFPSSSTKAIPALS